MDNFIFQNPVKLIMGRGMISRLSEEIPADKRVMITFGGGSVKKNGVYDKVKEALKNHFTVEFWGIEPNPSIETLRKAIALGKEEKVDYLLAVGGGSVIDGTKLISAGLLYDGDSLGSGTCRASGDPHRPSCHCSYPACHRIGNE